MQLTTIGFDADDTLWQNEQFYQIRQARFLDLLAEHADPNGLPDRLLAVMLRNAKVNCGNAGFTLTCDDQPMRDGFARWWGMETGPETLEMRVVAPLAVSRRAVLGGLLAGCLLMAGCGKQWSWNEKITAEVQTPTGVVSGSSVIRRSLTHQDSKLAPPEARGASLNVSGEAAVVEVMPGRYLFVLLKDLPNPFEVFFPGETPVEVASNFGTLRETRELARDHYPLLVTFTDINDPTTVRKVDPDNPAATFGPGVSLRRITLEITDEAVTKGKVDALLPWLGSYYGKKLDGRRYETIEAENRFTNSLAAGDFDTKRWLWQ